MDTRRDFLKKGILLSGAAGISGMLPASIQRALAINPAPGSTFMDAEHIVVLMQENRSFDHCFGTLQGVRGFNDPRAITLPDKNLVWLQTNAEGQTYAPFRFDMKGSKATWMGSTPHSRSSQVDAFNLGKYDQWLLAKRPYDKKYANIPMTLGHYTREDIPFNYALADAFTICDQNFCSAMTSTNPNRLFFWTGTIRETPEQGGRTFIRNLGDWRIANLTYDTFPERLSKNGISWKFYQNDIDTGGGFTGEERAWLANFGCNPLEWFASYAVKYAPRYIESLKKQTERLPGEIKELETKLAALSQGSDAYQKTKTAIEKKKEVLDTAQKELVTFTPENFEKLSQAEKDLYNSAFTTNAGDPYFHEITTLDYTDGDTKRQTFVPKGDVLHQFRQDVDNGKLPTVSWLAGAQNFSDHPSAPWYGQLYVSEVLDILTKNPEVWKKTIVILTYDENDGYFDHVPPFVAPDPRNAASGKCSDGIDTTVEYIWLEQELDEKIPKREARGGPIGLGFRVPLIVASPWTRGGNVCSEVYDHTSTLKFLEKFLNKKFGKNIREDNISSWRRTVTGDLTAVFRPYNGEKANTLPFLKKNPFIEAINSAKFKKDPDDFRPLTPQEIAQINQSPGSSPLMSRQEPGVRPACPLPYQLYVDAKLAADKKTIGLEFRAGNEIFGSQSAGAPFNVHFPGKYLQRSAGGQEVFEAAGSRSYAVRGGDRISDEWPVAAFENGIYHLRAYGPNGFYREVKGTAEDPALTIACEYERARSLVKKLTGNLALTLTSHHAGNYTVEIRDNAYHHKTIRRALPGNQSSTIVLDLGKNHGWYDFSILVNGFNDFERRFGGHVETGRDSFTDPAMGRVVAS